MPDPVCSANAFFLAKFDHPAFNHFVFPSQQKVTSAGQRSDFLTGRLNWDIYIIMGAIHSVTNIYIYFSISRMAVLCFRKFSSHTWTVATFCVHLATKNDLLEFQAERAVSEIQKELKEGCWDVGQKLKPTIAEIYIKGGIFLYTWLQ